MTVMIDNESQLQILLESAVQEAIEKVSRQVLDMLQKRIMKDVYTTPNTWYHDGSGRPTYEFLNAWHWDAIQKKSGVFLRELYMHSDEMDYDEKTWKHGSPLWGDARANLDDILNLVYNGYQAGYTSDLRIYGMTGARHLSHKRKPYWSNLIKELFDKGKLDKMMTRALKDKFGSQISMSGTHGSTGYF